MLSTYCTFPDLLIDGGRLAEVVWPTRDVADGVAATLRTFPDAIVLRVRCGGDSLRGFAPGGLGA